MQAAIGCCNWYSGLATWKDLDMNAKSVSLQTSRDIIVAIVNTVLSCLFDEFVLLQHG